MMSKVYFPFFFLLILFPILTIGQIGPAIIIDSTINSAGVSEFESADLDNDGDDDIITASTGQNGSLAYYQNNLNSSFSNKLIIDSFSFCKAVATGDFNNDNWTDLIAIGGIFMEAKMYINNNGTFSNSVLIDSNISIQVNDVVVEDFDGNGSDDIVIIGQHSIDFYRNNGQGVFSKEVILSTSTSPLVLECLYLSSSDIDGDGDMDLICGETEGLVVYTNSGNAVFTPNYYSVLSEIVTLVLPIDIDNDLDLDIVIKNNAGEVKWFRNDGSGTMIFESVLTSLPNVIAFETADYNNDGFQDIYASYLNNISVFINDASHSFSNEVSIKYDNSLLMGEVQRANMDNAGNIDYLWSGSNNTIAYNINENQNCVFCYADTSLYYLYPNPTSNSVRTNDNAIIPYAEVYNSMGGLVLKLEYVNFINLSEFSSGIYIIKAFGDDGVQTSTFKVVKE